MENYIIASVITSIVIFILYQLLRSANRYLDIRASVKKSKRLRKKKFNGIYLTEKLQKKRKKHTNSFQKLKGKGKKLTKQYFTYKMSELHAVTKYSYGKLFKKTNKNLIIVVKHGKKTLQKFKIKKSLRNMIQVTNKYDCLDEFINYLHNLPEAILEKQDYDIFVGIEGISIGYIVK
jgi:hypothetical protein